ncbi:periplasmic heavy metal sensor [Oryzifoliimicrobium ureilyticus]|uniref:periplasmic heavy metal sensor n=1 Tax=Oryzifoliimicrobium ureilyticus TaxID=3113724 RepID=UPI003075F9ED
MNDQNYKRLMLGLLASNTFLICAMIGAGLVYLKTEPAPAVQRLPLAGEQLPGKERGDFQKALSDARRDVRSTAQDARQSRLEAAALMGEPNLDKQALADALKKARDAEYAVRAATEAKAVDYVAGLSVDERRRLAEGLIEREVPKPATK